MTLQQRSLFDSPESARRRDEGIARASSRFGAWIRAARSAAVVVATRDGTVSADSLRAEGVETPEGASFNIWGQVFRDERFVFAGYTKSARPEAHQNILRLWRLKRPTTIAEAVDYSAGPGQRVPFRGGR